jgi:O-6-methylguanine DNA methyltransferase
MILVQRTIASPLGDIRLLASQAGLVRLDFADGRGAGDQRQLARAFGSFELHTGHSTLLDAAEAQLAAYWQGRLRAFDLPLDLHGTPFQRRVWQALQAIPPGSTCAYHQLAAAIGLPHAARAVGAANGANPISIIVPCHRLVGADGRLRAYGGGLHRKQALLDHERRMTGDSNAAP